MSEAVRLYTPELLAAAVELAQYPPLGAAALHGEARAKTCGSTLTLDLITLPDGRIDRLGMRVRACAVGQASAALFARHAPGLKQGEIEAAHDAMTVWLAHNAPQPDWPGLDLIAPARDYPARHGAMLLPWKAAMAALSSAPASG